MLAGCASAPRSADEEAAHKADVEPGISSVTAAAGAAGRPLCHREDVLAVIPGTLDEGDIAGRLRSGDPAVIIKLGRNLAKVRRALDAAGALSRALCVERATMAGQRIRPAAEADEVPYFSLILVPPAEWDEP